MQNNLELQQHKDTIKQKIYPFIDEMVDALYTDRSNLLIEKVIETSTDKSIFLMFVMMYYSINVSLKNNNTDNDKELKRQQIKMLMNEFIQDPEKRQFCIELFASKFQDILSSEEIISNQRLVLKNN